MKAGFVMNLVGILTCMFSVHAFGGFTFGTNEPCPAFMNTTFCTANMTNAAAAMLPPSLATSGIGSFFNATASCPQECFANYTLITTP